MSGETSSGKLANIDTYNFLYLSSKYKKHPSKPATHISFNSHFMDLTSLVAWWPELLWKFSLAGEDPHSDHGLGSL
jgi:hypothetical protein